MARFQDITVCGFYARKNVHHTFVSVDLQISEWSWMIPKLTVILANFLLPNQAIRTELHNSLAAARHSNATVSRHYRGWSRTESPKLRRLYSFLHIFHTQKKPRKPNVCPPKAL